MFVSGLSEVRLKSQLKSRICRRRMFVSGLSGMRLETWLQDNLWGLLP